jgi:hypothetical protein
MVDKEATERASIGALADEETFLQFAQHLKALHLRLSERRRMFRATERGLRNQIRVFAAHCEEIAARNPRCCDMWADALKEFETFEQGTAEI